MHQSHTMHDVYADYLKNKYEYMNTQCVLVSISHSFPFVVYSHSSICPGKRLTWIRERAKKKVEEKKEINTEA